MDARAPSTGPALPVVDAFAAAIVRADTDEAVIATDLDGIIRVFNPGAEHLLGYTAHEVVGSRSLLALHHPPDIARRAVELGIDPGFEVLADAARGGAPARLEWTYVAKDGSTRQLLSVVSVLRDGDGVEIGFVDVAHDPTPDHAAQSDLVAVALQVRSAFTNSVLPRVIIRDRDDRILAANPAFVEALGWPPEELIGTTVADAGFWPHPEHRASSATSRDATAHIEHAEDLLTRDGEPRRVLARVEAMTLAGEPCTVASFYDITDRERLRERLQESEAMLQAFLDFAPVIMSARDTEGNLVVRNRRFLAKFGRPGDEELDDDGAANTRILSAEDIELIAAVERRVIETALDIRREIEVVETDGSRSVYEFTKFPIRSFTGDVYAVGTIGVDVTEDRAARAALRDSEERFRQMADSLDELFLLWDAETLEMLYVSPAVERITGLDAERYRDPAARLAIVHPDDRAIAMNPPEPVKDMRIIRPDGETRWIRARTNMVRTPEGIVERGATAITDITVQTLAALAEQSARAEAERANQAKSEFLSRTSHELRTPLNAILGFGQLMATDEDLDAKHRDQAQQITKAGRHLLELIDEVLDISRIESGQIDISLEPVRVGDVVETAIDLVRPGAVAAGVRLIVEPDPGSEYVRADRHRLIQVALNLLTNAVKYNRPGGEVRVSVESPGPGIVRLVVADSGIGIAADARVDLFTPFARLGAERTDIEGTGLGLAHSQFLVEAMHGTIGAESEPGVGSTFWVDLPRAGAQHALPAADPHDPRSSATTLGTPRTILFVEDNTANVHLMQDLVARRPEVTLVVATSGTAGLELARHRLPCLVLLDLNLPEMSGQEVLRRLKAEPATASILVVIVSADATPAQVDRLLAQGAAGYLTKPFRIDEVLAVIDRSDPAWPGTPVGSDRARGSPEHAASPPPPAAARESPIPAPPQGSRGTVLYVEDDLANRALMTAVFAHRFPDLDLVVAQDGDEGLRLASILRPRLIFIDGALADMDGATIMAGLRANPATASIPIALVSSTPAPTSGLASGTAAHLVRPIDIAALAEVVDRLLVDPPGRPGPAAPATAPLAP